MLEKDRLNFHCHAVCMDVCMAKCMDGCMKTARQPKRYRGNHLLDFHKTWYMGNAIGTHATHVVCRQKMCKSNRSFAYLF